MTDPTPASTAAPILRTTLDAAELTARLRQELAGVAADAPIQPVVWTDGDSEVVVYPDAVRIALRPGLLLVELPMATDQTGATPAQLVVPFSVGSSAADATLVAVTEEVPRGNAVLAARWGELVPDAVWQALLRAGAALSPTSAEEPTLVVAGLFVEVDALTYVYTRPVTVGEIVDYYSRPRRLIPLEQPVAIPVSPAVSPTPTAPAPIAPAPTLTPTPVTEPTASTTSTPRTPP